MNTKKTATEFKRKYRLKAINSAILRDVLVEQGYTVVEFNCVQNTKDVNTLIEALGLEEQILQSKCFTYKNDKYRLVFIHEDLNDEERTIVLAHEEGHIWNGHMSEGVVLGDDVIQEYQANEFSHYLLKDKNGVKKRRMLISIIGVLIMVIVICVGLIIINQHDKAVYTDNLYVTDTGTKYHLRDCMYIREKTDVHRLTLEDFESGLYEPCAACMPGGE